MKLKIKRKFYYSESGCVAIYCGGSIIRYRNGYGDGQFAINVCTEKEIKELQKHHIIQDLEFLTTAYFKNGRVLSYDQYGQIDMKNDNCKTLFILNGEYAIYNYNGDVYFVKENIKEENE